MFHTRLPTPTGPTTWWDNLGAHPALRWAWPGLLTHGPGQGVYLSFDDGPHPATTPALLAQLAQAGAKATFFVLGQAAHAHPHLVQAMLQAGHTVGLHGHRHRSGWRTWPPRHRADLAQACRVLAPLLGHPPQWYRPPHGHLPPYLWAQALAFHSSTAPMQLMLWTHLARDYDPRLPLPQAKARLQRHLFPRSVVVLHEHPARMARTQALLALALAHSQHQGLHCMALPARLNPLPCLTPTP